MNSPPARRGVGPARRSAHRVSRRLGRPTPRRIPIRRTGRVLPRWILGLAIAAVLVVCAVAFTSAFLELYRLQREADQLLRLRHSLQQETAVLREEIRLLHTPAYIEKIAREQLGLVKPGEIALLIVQPPPKIPSPQTPPPAQTSWLSRALRALGRLFSVGGKQ